MKSYLSDGTVITCGQDLIWQNKFEIGKGDR